MAHRPPAFVGTFTATRVTELRPGDLVQWYAELGTVVDAPARADGEVRFRLALPSRIRPTAVALPDIFVLMTRRPEGDQP